MIRIWFSQLPARVAMAFIYGYQVTLSPFFAGSCRFVPSCSTYALEAVAKHGALRGSWLAIKRLLRCHPFYPGGLDQVPTAPDSPVAPKR